MGKTKARLNHSRYLDYGAKAIGNSEYEYARNTPTSRQKKFFISLIMRCKENNITPTTGQALRSRADYAVAIDALIKTLNKNGIAIKGNGKQSKHLLIIDGTGVELDIKERLVVEENDAM